MITDLSDAIVDIVTNSLRARAKNVAVSLVQDLQRNRLTIRIRDDGNGMDEGMLRNVTDPFFSTKPGKRIGLGVPLLEATTELCNGKFSISSHRGEGTEVVATFQLDHPDLPPLGNVKDAILGLLVTNPETDFTFRYRTPQKTFVLDTKKIREPLGMVPLNNPEVIVFLRNYLEENL